MVDPYAGGVLVLGMHRSGTSCLTGCLQAAGLHVGDVNTSARHNKRGNREVRAIMDLNDKVLAANGGHWNHPPSEQNWSDEHREERDRLLRELAVAEPWGFKDPRTLLTLSGWLERMRDPVLVASFRHPLAVAHSLRRRNEAMDLERGLALWLRYNARLVELAQERAVHLIDYDLAGAEYAAKVRALAAEIGLPHPELASSFFEARLKNNAAPDEAPPAGEIAQTYSRLLELAR